MASLRGAEGVEGQIFSDSDVQEPRFRVRETTVNGVPGRHLFLCAYELIDPAQRKWVAKSEANWPLLATVLPDRIVMRPRHVNPHAQHYLSPKNGQFETVTFVDDRSDTMATTAMA